MNHHITDTDNLFTYREPAWHGIGNIFDEYPTKQQAWDAAFGWEPVLDPIYRMIPTITEDGNLTEVYEKVETHQSVVRSDNGFTLGVVSDGYTPVNNMEMFDILEGLESEARGEMPVKFETAGSIKGGRTVWALLRLEEPLTVKGDPNSETVAYFAIQNSHDGSGALKGRACNTRIVCANTISMSSIEAKRRGTEFTFRHTSNVKDRIEDAKMALTSWRQGQADWSEMMNYLITVPVTSEQRNEFIDAFIPMPITTSLISDRVKNNVTNARDEMLGLFGTETMEGIGNTAYGLVQASIEWSQHIRRTKGRTDRDRMENKFKRAYLDDSEFVRTAVKITKDLLNV